MEDWFVEQIQSLAALCTSYGHALDLLLVRSYRIALPLGAVRSKKAQGEEH